MTSYRDLIQLANGHLTAEEATDMFNTVMDKTKFDDANMRRGTTAAYARLRVAQRLYTNPALSDELAAKLESEFDLAAPRTMSFGDAVSEGSPVQYKQARANRVANYVAKHGKPAVGA